VLYCKMLVLRFSKEIVGKPIISYLVRDHNLTFNILRAHVYPRQEGFVILELSGEHGDFKKGIQYLKDVGVRVHTVSQEIQRDDELCYQCGACTAVCPTGALYMKRPEMEVVFDPERCSACELCVRACPAKAMRVTLDRDWEEALDDNGIFALPPLEELAAQLPS